MCRHSQGPPYADPHREPGQMPQWECGWRLARQKQQDINPGLIVVCVDEHADAHCIQGADVECRIQLHLGRGGGLHQIGLGGNRSQLRDFRHLGPYGREGHQNFTGLFGLLLFSLQLAGA